MQHIQMLKTINHSNQIKQHILLLHPFNGLFPGQPG